MGGDYLLKEKLRRLSTSNFVAASILEMMSRL
jgi:hypothetical protein